MLTVESTPLVADVRFLHEGLLEFNREATGGGEELGVFERLHGEFMGGAYGWTWGGTCYLRYVFVPEVLRRLGLGRKIMRAVESEARRRGCHQIMLETHSFQAPGFYRKLGFEVTCEIADYPRGHRHMTMVKRLGE
jgi:GNAT superfamily N-acetyltransferase